MSATKVLIGHLNSNGDCLFSTVIARQIKEIDYPGCRLTWAVSSRCRQSIELNPYVDEIWEIPTAAALTSPEEWADFVGEAEKRRAAGEFDLIFLTQIFDKNWFNYDGGIRSSIYNNYPHEITVPHQPVVRLSDAEIENVRQFAEKYRLADFRQIVLIECGADSFETALNRQTAFELASEFSVKNPGAAFILSSNKPLAGEKANIIDGSQLTFRENAELTRYCHLFIGCASGISWLATSDWAKRLPMVLVINQNHNPFSSMIYDHEYLDLPTDHLIEIKSDENAIKKLGDCLEKISAEGFAAARAAFGERIRLRDLFYLDFQLKKALEKLDIALFFNSLKRTVKRNGTGQLFSHQFAGILRNLLVLTIKKPLKALGFVKESELAELKK